MIWQNPWAWLGLGAVALPILIHLLGRGHARVQRFPTLRFLESSKLLPTRRTRVHDVALLIVRAAIIAIAVAAFAQPLWLTPNRTRTLDAALARAIIVDTSASMSRATPAGERAVDAARHESTRLAGDAQSNIVVASANPGSDVAGAVAWLARQPGRTELVLISDFQLGAIDSASIASIPSPVGVRLLHIDAKPQSQIDDSARVNGVATIARIVPSTDRTDVEWTVAAGNARATDSVAVFAGASERARVNAAASAARTEGVRLPLVSATSDIAIVMPHFEQRVEWLRRASSPTKSWMVELIARLRVDAVLQRSASNGAPLGADTSKGITAVSDANGRPVVIGVQDSTRLLLVSSADAGSLTTALLIASVRQSSSRAAPLAELEQTSLPESVLAVWQRAPSTTSATRATANPTAADSEGRWLWIAVLVLLGVEASMRRARREAVAEQRAHDRAA